MRLHRFFIDQNAAFESAAKRFDPAYQEGLNDQGKAVSQNPSQQPPQPKDSCAMSNSVSQSPLYNLGGVISTPSEALIHQITNVFRFNKEDVVILTDGSDFDYVARIVSIAPTGITFHVDEVIPHPFSPRLEITLYAGIPKGDTFEWIAEKATELGVARIVPVVTERSMKKDVRLERLQKIITEASEQSGRTVVAAIAGAMNLKDASAECARKDFFKHVIVLDPTAHETLRDIVRSIAVDGEVGSAKINATRNTNVAAASNVPRVALLVGPEGGWSPSELAQFSNAGFTRAKLGQTILRAETACCAGLSLLLA